MKEKPLVLGATGVVEDLIRKGRTPIFSDPVTIEIDGLPKKRVPCTVPEEEGREPLAFLLYPPVATQIGQRIKHEQSKHHPT